MTRRFLLPAAAALLGLAGGVIVTRFVLVPEIEPAAPQAPDRPDKSAAERATVLGQAPVSQALQALPYVDGTYDAEAGRQGVLLYDEERAFAGLNLYCSRELKSALLLDMSGKVVRRWRFPAGVDHCQALPNGEVIGLRQDRGLTKVDAASRVLWRYDDEAHHAFWVDQGGEIFLLARRRVRRPDLHPTLAVYEDAIVVLSSAGRKLREISLLGAIERSPYRFLLPAVADRPFAAKTAGGEPVVDLLHPNQVEVFDGSLAARSPLFARGNLLVSFRNVSSLAILDPSGERILWLWGPSNLAYPHHPSLLPAGTLLLFNNGTDASEVLEIDPATDRVVWRWGEGKEFFSATRGSCQRLPNGNTLVTESNKGYVFELTPAGEKVWVWANPLLLEGQVRAYVWRMWRYRPEELPFLAARPESPQV